ncbi:hypothetical protein Rctr197k_199 [Virus Rctr197k]|nr:hypothetical protein Rctr197k_199 [Virus Rctr197k]
MKTVINSFLDLTPAQQHAVVELAKAKEWADRPVTVTAGTLSSLQVRGIVQRRSNDEDFWSLSKKGRVIFDAYFRRKKVL